MNSRSQKSLIFFLIVSFLIVGLRSVPYARQSIADQHLGVMESFKLEIPADTFENDDGSAVRLSLSTNNRYIEASFSESNTYLGGYYYVYGTQIVMGDDLIFLTGKYHGLYLFDISTANSPSYVGNYDSKRIIQSYATGDDEYVYLLLKDPIEILILDISNRANPVVTGKTEEGDVGRLYSVPCSMIVKDNFLYVNVDVAEIGEEDRCVKVINVTDKNEPKSVTCIRSFDEPRDLFINDNDFLYVVNYNTFFVFDVSEKENIVTYPCFIDIDYGKVVVVDGNYAYVAEYYDGVKILDVSASPIVLVSTIGSTPVFFMDLYVSKSTEDDVLFVLNAGDEKIEVFNVTNKSEPFKINECEFEVGDTIVDSVGNFFFKEDPDNSLLIAVIPTFGYGFSMFGFNTTDFSSPCSLIYETRNKKFLGQFSSEFEPLGSSTSMSYLGIEDVPRSDRDFVYVCDEDVLRVFNVSDLRRIRISAEVKDIGDCKGLSVKDEYIYFVQCYYYTNCSLRIVDISLDPTEPAHAGRCEGLAFPRGLFVSKSGDRAYVSSYVGIYIVDVSDVYNPTLIETMSYLDSTQTWISDDEEFMFISRGLDFFILNYSDPTQPFPMGSLEIGATTFVVSSDSNWCVLGNPTEGLSIIDTTDKNNPTMVGLFGSSEIVEVTNNVGRGDDDDDDDIFSKKYIFLSRGESGASKPYVQVIDVSSKEYPRTVAELQTGQAQYAVSRNNIIYVADGMYGLKVYEMDLLIEGTSDFEFFCGDLQITVVAEDSTGSVEESFVVSREDYCNGRGECLKNLKCSCRGGFEGFSCESWSCGGYDFKSVDKSCSGKGNCIGPDQCDCRSGYSGKRCQTNILYGAVMAPILSIAFAGVFCCFILGCVCVCISCCIGFLVLVLVLVGLFLLVVKQTRGIRKFSQLRNFELYLKEQEMEDDDSIAHIRFDKKLFEIPLDEIKTLRAVGEGGSNSMVFESLWRGKRCAFKCFKTRMVCANQDSFAEFEKEVSILSSLAHPNIVRFYGACLNPPRVGIIMEFCSKGEILEFCIHFRESRLMGYPIIQKIRMIREVSSALEFLHSKSIIHRDLKAENVLIADDESAKLMDFGLSRVVDNISAQKTKRVGTSFYMSPEMVLADDYDELCDVFSLSVFMYVVLTEKPNPYEDLAEQFKIEIKVANDPDFRPDLKYLDECFQSDSDFQWVKNLIVKCWSHESKDRYSVKEIGEILSTKGSIESFEMNNLGSSSSLDNMMSKTGTVTEVVLEEENNNIKKKVADLEKIVEEKDGVIESLKVKNLELKDEIKSLKMKLEDE